MSSRDDAMDPSRDETSEMPTLILPYLYLGGKVVARSRESLDKLNIRSIINCTPSRNTDPRAGVPNFFQAEKDRFTYRRVPVFDSAGSNLSSFFASCADFIDQSKHHGAVLVHCVQGVSRSTSIVLAYLMKKKGVPLDKALAFVKKRRPIVRPNRSFMKQLRDFEHRVFAARRAKETGVRAVAGPARPTPAPAATSSSADETGDGASTATETQTPNKTLANDDTSASEASKAAKNSGAGPSSAAKAAGNSRKRSSASADSAPATAGEGDDKPSVKLPRSESSSSSSSSSAN